MHTSTLKLRVKRTAQRNAHTDLCAASHANIHSNKEDNALVTQ